MGTARGGSVSTSTAPRRGRLVSLIVVPFFLSHTPTLAQSRVPTASPPIWTQVPTRIDRSKDTRERVEIPPPPPGFVVAGDGRPDAAGHLIVDGRRYRLFGLAPIASDRLCTAADGRRWACGVRGRALLSGLVVGNVLRCHHVGDPAAADPVVDCRYRDRSLTETVVSAGLAELDADGAADPTLAAALDGARRARVGIWSAVAPP